jgi:SNF2 family DNA or RNA helicase
VGLSDSFEAYYQAVRRCWRFGQKHPVEVHIIISEAEGAVKQNIERKQKDAERMTQEMVKHTKEILKAEIQHTIRISENYVATEEMIVPAWLEAA